MFTPRQARHGLALLSLVVLATTPVTAEPPVVQAEATDAAGEGGRDRGLGRPRPEADQIQEAPAAPPQSDNAARGNGAPPAATPAGPPPLREAVVPQNAAAAAARHTLNEYLVRDRTVAIQLARAAEDVDTGRYDDAVTALQTILDASTDVFVWPESNGPPVSARSCAADLFRRFSPEALDEYERRYGADARRLWAEFVRTSQAEFERELLRRFEFTLAGADALQSAADRAFDRGEFVEAARRYARCLAHPQLARGGAPELRLRAEAAVVLAAAAGVTVVLPEYDWNRPLRRGDRVQPAGKWRAELLNGIGLRSPPAEGAERSWRLAFGSAQGHRPAAGSLPTLDPLWSASHEPPEPTAASEVQVVSYDESPRGADLLQDWLAARHERRLPCSGATFALLDGERVLVRDFSGVTARDLRTGEVLWQYPCASGLARRIAELQAASRTASTPGVALDAAPLFNELFAQNSVLGMLASDGLRVYCVDLLPATEIAEADSTPEAANRLLALALDDRDQPAGTVVWETDGDGWFFLGPPLPVDDRLYVIAERDSLVSLLALSAGSGATVWEQPISLVDAPIGEDPQRARQACCPTISGGVIVCPTQLGTIVGVDARSGALLWVYAYAEATGPSQPWRKSRSFDREHGTPEYPNLPEIVGDTVIVLAPQSVYVHAVDLQTGHARWTADRGDAQYSVTANEELVLLVGPRECVARRVADGAQVWRQSIDPPTGRGLAVGNSFLLPASDGRIVALDLGSGRLAPDLLPRPERTRRVALRATDPSALGGAFDAGEPWPVSGNLLCSGEFIVACSPAGVAVYPQAQAVLAALEEAGRTQSLSASAWLERGELELRLGDAAAAERSLLRALESGPSPGTRSLAESRLRELLYAQLSQGINPEQRLAALDRLCNRPDDRARYLAARLERELQMADAAAACRTAAAIARLDIDQPVAMDGRGQYFVVPQRRAAAALARSARGHSALPGHAREPASAQELDLLCLPEVVEGCRWSASIRARRSAAIEALLAAGEHHAAELMLVAELRQTEAAVRQPAAERLAALWRQCGLHADAERVTDDALPRRDEPLTASILRVEIEQRIVRDETSEPRAVSALETLLSRNREYARHPPGARVLFDRGLQRAPDPFSSLAVVDVTGPKLVAELPPLPPRVWKVGDSSRYDAGHFLPIVGNGDVHGLSLLEGRIVWSATPEQHRAGEKVTLGPYGPEFCILQSQETVTALDPRDGRVLWRRTDLPFDAGLEKDDVLGMFADEAALVIFHNDFLTHRVLDPRSGELLTSGVLEPPAEPRRRGWCLGRRLLYLNAQKPPRLRLWDPLLAELPLDLPCEGRCLVDPGLGDGLAAILAGRRLLILDTRSAAVLWETELSDTEAATTRQVRAVRDGRRFCIHVEQDVPNSALSQATHDISSVPNIPLSGTLFVIDRRSLEHWSRPVPRCNLLLFPNDELPVLVTLGRIREGQSEAGSTFVLEVIDGATGRTLATRNDLTRTSKLLLHTRYDVGRSMLQLRGVDSEIDVKLVRAP